MKVLPVAAAMLLAMVFVAIGGCADDSELEPFEAAAQSTPTPESTVVPTAEPTPLPQPTADPEPAEPTPQPRGQTDAQSAVEEGLIRWVDLAVEDYTLTLGTGEDSRHRVVEVRGGEVTSDRSVDGQGNEVAPDVVGLLGSVDEIFAEVAQLAGAAADNPPAEPGGCDGRHVHVEMDIDTGVPSAWHDYGPCAEGPGFNATVEVLN